MKNILLIFGLLIQTNIVYGQSAATRYEMTEDLVSIGTDFTLSNGQTVVERTFSISTTFDFLDVKKNLIAKGERKILSLSTVIEVSGPKGEVIGSIEEKIFDSLTSIGTIYSIKDAKGKIVGTSKKIQFFATSITIYDLANKPVVRMEKSIFSLKNTWMVTILNPKAIDSRILALIPAFKTQSDKEKKRKDAGKVKRRIKDN